MPAPRRPLVDTGDILGDMMRNPVSDEELECELEEDLRRGREEMIAWLNQYDDDGHMKPGVLWGPGYIPNMSLDFIGMSPDEKAAYVISKKREYGLM